MWAKRQQLVKVSISTSKSLSAITFRQLPGSKTLKWDRASPCEFSPTVWNEPPWHWQLFSFLLMEFILVLLWLPEEINPETQGAPSVCYSSESRNEHCFISCNDHGSPFFTALPSLPPQWESKGQLAERKVAEWLFEHTFVTLGIIEAPVVGEQLGGFYSWPSTIRLGLRGVLKDLYRDKSKGRE